MDKGVGALRGSQRTVFSQFIAPQITREECCVCGQSLGPSDDVRRIGPENDACCARHLS